MTAVAEVLAGLDAVIPPLEDLYRDLHAHPELSMQEHRTAGEVERRLTMLGYATRRIGGGVVGVLANGEGATVLFRADMDALPIREETGLPYASTATALDAAGATVPVMHACGHDLHVACGLGAAQLLAERRSAWSGTYVALFQPGEETAAGARSMVDAGLVDALPRPDVALAQHVLTSPWAGQVATASGPVLSTGASLRITLFGSGSHGSMPHRAVDPVVLGAAVVTRLQTIVAREIAPGDFGVVTVGSFQAGSVANVIPDSASLLVNIRAYDEGVRAHLVEAIGRIVRAESQAARSPREPEIEVYDSYPLTSNDAVATERVTRALVAHLGAERVVAMEPAPASEDFGVIPAAFGAPSVYWGLGGFAPGSAPVPNHNPGFAPALQPTLRTGVEAAVIAALAWLAPAE